jgi:hypothetical protein
MALPAEQPAPQSLPANVPGDVWAKLDANPLQLRDPPNLPETVGHGSFMANVSTVQAPPSTGTPDTDTSNVVRVEPVATAAIQEKDPTLSIAGMLAGFALILAAFARPVWRRVIFANGHGAAWRNTIAPKFARTIFDIKDVPPPFGSLEPLIDDKEMLRKLLRDLEGSGCPIWMTRR